MSEAGDWDPGPWQGHDFNSAKKKYDIHVGRSYSDAKSSNIDPLTLVPSKLITECRAPLVVACDVTGSMGESPATIFSKCPYLDLEGREYLGPDMEICFAAVGDAYSDQYPLQVRPFDKGLQLKKRLEELVIEGNGGGQQKESYDLAALYFAENVEMPNALNPIFIFIGDEGIYDFVNKEQAHTWAHVDLEKRMSFQEVLKALKRKYAVYIIRQPYVKMTGDQMSETDRMIHEQWASALGEDHIAFLPDAARVVDVIFGILAKECGKVDYFRDEITQRQTADQVNVAFRGLSTIHGLPAPPLKTRKTSKKNSAPADGKTTSKKSSPKSTKTTAKKSDSKAVSKSNSKAVSKSNSKAVKGSDSKAVKKSDSKAVKGSDSKDVKKSNSKAAKKSSDGKSVVTRKGSGKSDKSKPLL